MATHRAMNTWVFVALVTLLAGVQAGFHPSSYSSVGHGDNEGHGGSHGDNPLGRHWDWKLPLSNDESSLSPPTEGYELKFMGVLRGTWNWTCETSDEHSKPFSVGGVGVVIDTSEEIQHMETEEEYYDWVTDLAHDPISDFNDHNYKVLGDFVQLEAHLGYSDFRPHAEFYGTMSEIIPAPHDAPKGPDGSNAIVWGRFNAVEGSWGVKQIYRVKAAGGKAPATCDGLEKHFEIDFAASAWIYN